MKRNLKTCPNCDSPLMVTRYSCSHCPTEITGYFSDHKFSRLSEEDLHFIELFVLCRGNIKDLEKELNLSYPSVRNRLDQVIEKLKLPAEDYSRMEILDSLDAGEIGVDEALTLLRKGHYE